jgi:hypothetical protein
MGRIGVKVAPSNPKMVYAIYLAQLTWSHVNRREGDYQHA